MRYRPLQRSRVSNMSRQVTDASLRGLLPRLLQDTLRPSSLVLIVVYTQHATIVRREGKRAGEVALASADIDDSRV
jgi:hypothetical protein